MKDIAEQWMDKIRAITRDTVFVIQDWDDKVIAAVTISAKCEPEQRLVQLNEWVRRNLIHPDLYDAPVYSKKRKHTYRGKYAYKVGRPNNRTYTRADGPQYPLTNKLDYKYVTGRVYKLPSGVYEIRDDPNDPYPYLRGLMHVKNPMSPPWTTLGTVGDDARYYHVNTDGVVDNISRGVTLPISVGQQLYTRGVGEEDGANG